MNSVYWVISRPVFNSFLNCANNAGYISYLFNGPELDRKMSYVQVKFHTYVVRMHLGH